MVLLFDKIKAPNGKCDLLFLRIANMTFLMNVK